MMLERATTGTNASPAFSAETAAVVRTRLDGAIPEMIETIGDAVPEYAGRLFDYHCDNPNLLRLVTWARLEGRTTPSAQEQRRASYRRRVAAIEDAQHKGAVTTALSGSQLLDIIESLAVGWTAAARGVLATPRQLKAERTAQRKAITEAARRIVDPKNRAGDDEKP